jgi:putative membrane protein
VSDPFNLADRLAIERTALANERTLLAYIRTSLALFVTAAAGLRFGQTATQRGLALAVLPVAIAIAIVGVVRFVGTRRRIRER